MKPLDQSKNFPKSERIASEKQKVAGDEYLLARLLHDRFCKFEIPYKAPETIKIIRDISKYIPLIELKEANLSFKLNSLRWFLTTDGKEFLKKARKRYLLDQKLEKLDLDKVIAVAVEQSKQLDLSAQPAYTTSAAQKTGENRDYKKEVKTLAGFLHN